MEGEVSTGSQRYEKGGRTNQKCDERTTPYGEPPKTNNGHYGTAQTIYNNKKRRNIEGGGSMRGIVACVKERVSSGFEEGKSENKRTCYPPAPLPSLRITTAVALQPHSPPKTPSDLDFRALTSETCGKKRSEPTRQRTGVKRMKRTFDGPRGALVVL